MDEAFGDLGSQEEQQVMREILEDQDQTITGV